VDAIGDIGVCYVSAGYSAMGQLLSMWMGIEGTILAAVDWPRTMREVIDQINQNNLRLIDTLAASSVEFILMGDNFSSDVQPPRFFDQWSKTYYIEAIRRLHAAGKYVAVHIDGRLLGAIKMIQSAGADCADAVTPTPMGDLTPQQCRDEAGRDFILSGGVSPDLWLSSARIEDFKKAVLNWLALKVQSPRLIANAGDEVPLGAEEDRIEIMRDLVEQHGKY
jgi:uroporphyrinogen-III decarboxylase